MYDVDQLEFQVNINFAEWQRAGEMRGRSHGIKWLDGEIFTKTTRSVRSLEIYCLAKQFQFISFEYA